MQQVGNLSAGIGKFQLAPWFSLSTAALGAGFPLAIVILEERRAAGRAHGLSDRSQRQNEFSQAAAIDIRDVLQVDQNPGIPLGDFIADGVAESGDRVASRYFSRK